MAPARAVEADRTARLSASGAQLAKLLGLRLGRFSAETPVTIQVGRKPTLCDITSQVKRLVLLDVPSDCVLLACL